MVQGQIGGESRPGSLSASFNEGVLRLQRRKLCGREPSGRLLDPGSNAGTRGMIAAARDSLRELGARQNPAYRLPAYFESSARLVLASVSN